MTTPYGFLTTTGREREAEALANNTAIDVAEIAWGDDPRTITGGETALGNEVDRALVAAQGQVSGQPNVAFFRHVFAPSDGPFTIHEAGLFASDGALLAIVSYPLALSKPINFELTLDLYVAFSDLQNLTINVSTAGSFVPSERVISAGSGLAGGGDLSLDRSFAIDWTGLASIAGASVNATEDVLALRDGSASAHKKITVDEFVETIKGLIDFFPATAGAVGSLVTAGSSALTELTEYPTGHTVPGSSLVHFASPNNNSNALSSGSVNVMEVVSSDEASFGYSGTWRLLSRLYVQSDNTRPTGLWQRIA